MRRLGLLYLLLCGCLIASWQSFAQMPMTGAGVPLTSGAAADTWDPNSIGTEITLSSGNLIASTSSGWTSGRALTGHTSGKVYCEFLVVAGVGSDSNIFIGVMDSTTAGGAGLDGFSAANSAMGRDDGFTGAVSGPPFTPNFTSGYGTYSVNDTLQVAVDFSAKNIWFGRNNTWASSGNPGAGTNPAISWSSISTPLYPSTALDKVSSTAPQLKLVCGSGQVFSPPSGFSAWN